MKLSTLMATPTSYGRISRVSCDVIRTVIELDCEENEPATSRMVSLRCGRTNKNTA